MGEMGRVEVERGDVVGRWWGGGGGQCVQIVKYYT